MVSCRTVLLLIRMFLEYCQCVNDIPSVATDMLTRLSDLLKVSRAASGKFRTAHSTKPPPPFALSLSSVIALQLAELSAGPGSRSPAGRRTQDNHY